MSPCLCDDRPENLELMDGREHSRMHARELRKARPGRYFARAS